MIFLLSLGCADADSADGEDDVVLDPDFVGEVGARLSAGWVTWLDDDGYVHTRDPAYNPVPDGKWLEVSGQGLFCARNDTEIVCWDADSSGPTWEGTVAGNFVQVSAGAAAACAVTPSADLQCWGELSEPPLTHGIAKVSVGVDDGACVLDLEGAITCWGANMGYWMPNYPRSGKWIDVAAGFDISCAVAEDLEATCWGVNEESGGSSPDPNDRYTAVSAGGLRGCALSVDGRMECWIDPLSHNDYVLAGDGYVEISGVSEAGICALPPVGDPVCSQDQ